MFIHATNGCFAVTLLAVNIYFLSTPLRAEESGKWRGLGVLVTTEDHSVQVADQKDHAMMLGHEDGVVFNDGGGSFLDKARYEVVYGGDTAGAFYGYKTFTAADGSRAFARFEVTEAAPPVLKGTWEFTDGTGAHKGITGSGVFTYTNVAEGVAYDVLEGEYKVP
jgi:hypothetical protein